MIRRYRSFRSLAAKRPPSKGTRGLNSGGITGKIDTTIHSGLFIFFKSVISTKNDFTTFNLFKASSRFCLDFEFFKTSSKSRRNSTRFIRANISFSASPPIAA